MAVARAPTPPVLLGPSRSRKPAWHHGQVARRVRIHPQDRPTQLDIHLGVPSAPLPLRLARRAAIPQHQPPVEPVGSLSCQHGLLEVCFFGTPGLVSMGTRSGGVLLRAGARGGSKRIVELVVAARALTIALALALALTGAKEDLQPSKGDLPEGRSLYAIVVGLGLVTQVVESEAQAPGPPRLFGIHGGDWLCKLHLHIPAVHPELLQKVLQPACDHLNAAADHRLLPGQLWPPAFTRADPSVVLALVLARRVAPQVPVPPLLLVTCFMVSKVAVVVVVQRWPLLCGPHGDPKSLHRDHDLRRAQGVVRDLCSDVRNGAAHDFQAQVLGLFRDVFGVQHEVPELYGSV
mmetsp:Transcript_3599/g.13025  ORF Transcript_3599/g.13025 Transcript_3599/m.13025 type:complete len:349 (-) Transcript_3599:254-1300(-)